MKKVTTNKDGSPRKSGSGRKKGATSFANITLAELEKFCGSATGIPVSRVWLEQMGASIQGSALLPYLLFNHNQKKNKKSPSLYISKFIKVYLKFA
jgi:hypothetical protein